MFKLLSYVRLAFSKLYQDNEGASLAEYALLLGMLTVALAVTVGLLGGAIGNVILATAGYFGVG